MNIKEYIESGKLEAFVLGALSQEEQTAVQADIDRYPELAKEVAALEADMMRFAQAEALTPPPGLQDKIWDSIQASGTASQEKPAAQIIALPPSKHNTRWSYAAIWVALISSVALNTLFWYQNSQQKQESRSLSYKLDTMSKNQQALAELVGEYQKGKTMMADTGMQTIVMHTVLKGHPMAATLYWSKDKAEAYVMIDGLPEPPKGMQYQLWAIQGGKPVDMGVISNDMANKPMIEKVSKAVTSGEAFAISLEKAGGSPTPTMQNIYVMGKS